MPDAFDPVVAGDPLPTTARLFNALVARMRSAAPAPPQDPKFPRWNPMLIRVANSANTTISGIGTLVHGFYGPYYGGPAGVMLPTLIAPANLTGNSGEAACYIRGEFDGSGAAGTINEIGARSVPPMGMQWVQSVNGGGINYGIGGNTTPFTMNWACVGGCFLAYATIRPFLSLLNSSIELMRFQFPNENYLVTPSAGVPTMTSFPQLNRIAYQNDLWMEVLYCPTLDNTSYKWAVVRFAHRHQVRFIKGGQTGGGHGANWPNPIAGNSTVLENTRNGLLARPGPRTHRGRITWTFSPRWTNVSALCTGTSGSPVFVSSFRYADRLPATLETAWRIYRLNQNTGAAILVTTVPGPTLTYDGDVGVPGDGLDSPGINQVVITREFEHTLYLNDYGFLIYVEFVAKQTGGTLSNVTYGTGTAADPYQGGSSTVGIAGGAVGMFCFVSHNQHGVGGNPTQFGPPIYD